MSMLSYYIRKTAITKKEAKQRNWKKKGKGKKRKEAKGKWKGTFIGLLNDLKLNDLKLNDLKQNYLILIYLNLNLYLCSRLNNINGVMTTFPYQA